MSLSRVKTWGAEALLFVDLNSEFNNILDNALSLISPLTGNLNAGDNQVNNASRFGAGTASPSAPGHFTDEGSHTNTVVRNLIVGGTTSGAPAASIGTGVLVQAESDDENPSDFGALDFVASDVGAGTEDTYLSLLLRVAGRALDEKYRFSSTAGSGFAALFAHAVTADRTFTLQDRTGTIATDTSLVLLDTQTASTSASLEFSSTYITTSYSAYLFTVTALRPATDGTTLRMDVSVDNGSNYEATAYDRHRFQQRADGEALITAGSSATAGTVMVLTNALGNVAVEAVDGIVWLLNPSSDAVATKVISDLAYYDNTATAVLERAQGVFSWNSASAVNAVRFLPAAGNLTSGVIRLYGVRIS